MRIEVTGDVDRIYDQFQLDTMRREREQADRIQAAENKRLNVEDFQQFKRLRAERPIAEPNLDPGEMSYQDYYKTRAKEGRR